jgi:hypothetical protein
VGFAEIQNLIDLFLFKSQPAISTRDLLTRAPILSESMSANPGLRNEWGE